jgi:hypothetical protein
VLAFERCDRSRAAAASVSISVALCDFLEPATPALTRRLAPGLAFAEDPGPDESYGAQRCRLLAEAAVTAHEHGILDPDGRLGVVRERFADVGASLDRPHLERGSADDPDDLVPVRLEKERSSWP